MGDVEYECPKYHDNLRKNGWCRRVEKPFLSCTFMLHLPLLLPPSPQQTPSARLIPRPRMSGYRCLAFKLTSFPKTKDLTCIVCASC
jgi:hypothetical protein